MDWLQSLARFMLYTPPGLTGEAARYYIFQRVGYWIAVGSHLMWAAVFQVYGITGMALYNVVVALMFTGAALIWRRIENPAWLVVPLWFFEIPFHALLGTLHTGLTTLFWYVPLASAMASLLVYQWSWTVRVAWCAALLGVTLAISVTAFFVEPISQMSDTGKLVLFTTNFLNTLCGVVLYLGLNQYLVAVVERRLQREHDRAEGLLKNILPDTIALRLKDGEHLIADEHPEVTVIFADIVNFTEASAELNPAALVETLNLVFTEFDYLAQTHGAEKIKTIGDAYMAVIGAPDTQDRHAIVAVELALEMLHAARRVSAKTHFPIDLRIGINSGPVVAGVIGKNKFAYDLWGDAVNVASRMESLGQPGQILMTEATAQRLPATMQVAPAGRQTVKGKGEMALYSLSA